MDVAYPERSIISDKSRKLFEAWEQPDPKHGRDLTNRVCFDAV
jgi:hypothetical protein